MTRNQRLDPKRGLQYVDLARRLYERFVDKGRVLLDGEDGIDTFLIAEGHMPSTATDREKASYRHDYLTKVRQASTSPVMQEYGFTPFEVDCKGKNGWRVEELDSYLKRRKTIKKVKTQADRSAKKQRQYTETLTLIKGLNNGVAALLLQGANVQKNIVEKIEEEIGKLFDSFEKLTLMQSQSVQFPSLSPPQEKSSSLMD